MPFNLATRSGYLRQRRACSVPEQEEGTRRLRPLDHTVARLVWKWGIFCGITSSEMTGICFRFSLELKVTFENAILFQLCYREKRKGLEFCLP